MSLRVRCSKCQTAFMAADDRPGALLACPKCGARHKLPPGEAPGPPSVPSPPARGRAVDPAEEAASAFQPSHEARERSKSRRNLVVLGLLLLLSAAAAVALVSWPRIKPRSNDPVERVAEDYLDALVKNDAEVQGRLSVVEEPPAIRSFRDAERDRTRDRTIKGSFAPIAALHKKINTDFDYDPNIGRFTPRHPLGAAGETLDALHQAKADAEKSGMYDKMASGDPDDVFEAAENLGQVFSKLAEGALAPKKILPTYRMLVQDARPPLPTNEAALALDVADNAQVWDALLKRPFFTLKADGPFIFERAEVDASVVDRLGSLGDPPTRLRLILVRFRLEGIDTSWRVVKARRLLPGAPEVEEPPADPTSPPAPVDSGPPPPRSLGDLIQPAPDSQPPPP